MLEFKKYLNEVSLAKVWSHATDVQTPIAIITTFRNEYPLEQNITRNKELASQIKQAGYGYFFVDGSFIENKGTPNEKRVKEDSVFIVGSKKSNNLKSLLKNWMLQYEQDAVLYKPIGTNKALSLNKDGSESVLGEFHPNRIGSYMTKLKNRPGTFVFEAAFVAKNWLGRLAEDKGS
jgi:hypothetical protein